MSCELIFDRRIFLLVFAAGDKMLNDEAWNETLVEKKVTYSIEVEGRFVIIEDVPARVNVETGEKYFSPETVECLQQTVWERQCPRHARLVIG